jgi:hypothetical protein
MRGPFYVHSLGLPSHTKQGCSQLRDEGPDALREVANLSRPGACDLAIIFLGHLLKSLLAVDIAVRQNPWRILSVHELLGDVADKLRMVLL